MSFPPWEAPTHVGCCFCPHSQISLIVEFAIGPIEETIHRYVHLAYGAVGEQC